MFKRKFKGNRRSTTQYHIIFYKVRDNYFSSNWPSVCEVSFQNCWKPHTLKESLILHIVSRSLETLLKRKLKDHRRYTSRFHFCFYNARGNNSSPNWPCVCEVCVQNHRKHHTIKKPQTLRYVSRSLEILCKRKLKVHRRHTTHHNNCSNKPWSQNIESQLAKCVRGGNSKCGNTT